jgi:phage shock protein C
VILPPNRSRTSASALARNASTRAATSGTSSRKRCGSFSSSSPFEEGVAGQEPVLHQAQLGAGDEHHLGPSPPEPLRPLGAVREQRQQLVGGQVQWVRREPHLKAEIGGVGRGEPQPLRVAAHDVHSHPGTSTVPDSVLTDNIPTSASRLSLGGWAERTPHASKGGRMDATRKLYRSRTNRKVAGVCGGLAQYFNTDATVIRVLFVVLAVLGGSGLLIYLAMWIIVPSEP